MLITINGDCPSKKNSRILTFRGSRPMSFPGKNYSDWHRQASKQLYGKKLDSAVVKLIQMTFFPKTKRKGDLTNKAESIMDLLVDNSIISEDNWFVVPTILLNFGGVDPRLPRVEVEIR